LHYFGNVLIAENGDLSRTDLRQLGFQATLVTTGAQGTKWLGLDGEYLRGVYHAKDLVYHYNQLPPYASKSYPIGRRVALVGAGNVINLWDPQSHSFLRYSNPAFPNANSVDVVGADRKGRLWVSYDGKELAALDPSTGLFINFDPSDGAAGGGIDMENLEDGRVLLTGSGGMNIFDPDSILDIHRTPPPLVLTRMAINDRPVVLPASAGGSDALRLSYDQDVIEFEYAALDIDAPQLVEYRYKLEGLEKEWVASEARRYVRYAGLPPGVNKHIGCVHTAGVHLG